MWGTERTPIILSQPEMPNQKHLCIGTDLLQTPPQNLYVQRAGRPPALDLSRGLNSSPVRHLFQLRRNLIRFVEFRARFRFISFLL